MTLTDILRGLEDGSLGTDAAAARLATMTLPARTRSSGELDDPEPDPPGSFAEVESAFIDGRLTREQYDALAKAVGNE